MRLAGLAVLALALVGTLVLLGQNGAFDSVWERTSGTKTQVLTSSDNAVLNSLDIEGTSVFGAPAIQENPVILSGFPAYAGLSFDLPTDARPVSGSLNLDFTSLVAEDVEGALRISVNGQKRADYLLLQGDKDNSLQIELTGADLVSDTLSVGLSLKGRGPIAQCSVDDSIAAVVNISGRTGLRLELDKPVETARDRLALWGNRVPESWSSDAMGDEAAGLVLQSAVLESKGYKPVFVSQGVSLEELSTIAAEAAVFHSKTMPAAYPIALTNNPSNKGVKTFNRRASWRYSYAVEELPGEKLPAALDLRLRVEPTSDDVLRDMTVTINNRLLLSRRIEKGVEQFNQSIAIPAGAHRQSNMLEISVSANNPALQQCGDIPQSVAELLPQTMLRGGDAKLVGALPDVVNLLSKAGGVALDVETARPEEAAKGSFLLSALAPGSWNPSPDAPKASVRIFNTSQPPLYSQLSNEKSHWVIYSVGDDDQHVVARRIVPRAEDQTMAADGVVLLVTLENFIPLPPSTQVLEALELIGAS